MAMPGFVQIVNWCLEMMLAKILLDENLTSIPKSELFRRLGVSGLRGMLLSL